MRIGKSLLLAAVAAVVSTSSFLAGSASASIADVYANGAGTYTITGTVTGVLDVYTSGGTNTFTVQDATGSVLAYHVPLSTYTAAVGDNITLTANNSPYQGGPELATPFTVAVNSTGNPVTIPVETIPAVNASGNGTTGVTPLSEAIVTLDDVYLPAGTTSLTAKTTYTLSDLPGGLGNTLKLYTYTTDTNIATAVSNANSMGALLSGPLDITGYVDPYYGTPEFYPLSINSAVTPEPASLGLLGVAGMTLLRRRSK